MSKRILVTGGTGYIGSHATVELLQAGYEVVVADSLVNSDISVLERIEKITGKKPYFEKIDLCDQLKTKNLFARYPDLNAVMHFAAFKSVNESIVNPLKYYTNNLNSLINVLDNMVQYNINHLVFSSSCTVYGQPDKLPVDETAQIKRPGSPYGYTKQISEKIIVDLINSNKKINAISLRYFNPIGAHESALIGELPQGIPDNLVPFITQTAAGIRTQLKVFGNDYNTPDGSCIRDYINVVDLAKAHLISIKRLIENKNKTPHEVFNLGTGKGVTVLEAVKTFEAVTGITVNYFITNRREGDIEKVWADTSLANKELGWKSDKSLEETLLSAWNWEKYYREKIEKR
ncbi:MAG: UDP-glucose 4-epimerase GalE [Bacteroidota bacterium]